MQTLPRIIAIMGTNASGKSGLGIELASRYGGEVVSADSRQVFTGLDLGSGKVTQEEMRGVPHHLIDVCQPNDFFSMADFQKLAYNAFDDILSRDRLPFLVGGTGLYVASVLDGYQLSDKMPDLEYRAHLETFTTPELYQMLIAQLPDIEIDAKNRNRVMRVLEKLHDGDDVVPVNKPRYTPLKLGVSWPREVLNQRIDERLERRLNDGMIEEVQRLLDAGATTEFMYKLGLEYRFITQYLTGEIPDRDEMLSLLAIAIKQFAKRQMTWFRRDTAIHWLDMSGDPVGEACRLIDEFLSPEA